MTAASSLDRFNLIAVPAASQLASFGRDVAAGLTATPKHLSCRYFYDQEGSRLFEEICDLPEYYLTRAEAAILRERAPEIAYLFPAETALVELGSGNADKTRLLIAAFLASRPTLQYVPIDICRPILEQSSRELLQAYPRLDIVAVAAEYQEGLRHLQTRAAQTKLILWLGSNIGNLERKQAAAFLKRVRSTMKPADRLLVGIDLRKDRKVLEAAYDDAQGVTAEFNLNILARINRELDGRFDLAKFRHQAIYNEGEGRVEMSLVSTCAQRVVIGDLQLTVDFAAGEAMHTENSYKYSRAEIDAVARAADLQTEKRWLDPEDRFSLNLFAPCS